VLGPVPFPPQRRKRPRDLDARVGLALVQSLLDQRKTPVVGEPGRAAVRRQRLPLPWGGIEREPEGVRHHGRPAADDA